MLLLEGIHILATFQKGASILVEAFSWKKKTRQVVIKLHLNRT